MEEVCGGGGKRRERVLLFLFWGPKERVDRWVLSVSQVWKWAARLVWFGSASSRRGC